MMQLSHLKRKLTEEIKKNEADTGEQEVEYTYSTWRETTTTVLRWMDIGFWKLRKKM